MENIQVLREQFIRLALRAGFSWDATLSGCIPNPKWVLRKGRTLVTVGSETADVQGDFVSLIAVDFATALEEALRASTPEMAWL